MQCFLILCSLNELFGLRHKHTFHDAFEIYFIFECPTNLMLQSDLRVFLGLLCFLWKGLEAPLEHICDDKKSEKCPKSTCEIFFGIETKSLK